MKSFLLFAMLAAPAAALGQTLDLPALDGKELSPEMLASFKKTYCRDMDKANTFIDDLAKMVRENAAALRKGSRAEYENTIVKSAAGKEVERLVSRESWEVLDVQGSRVTMRIQNGNDIGATQELEAAALIYGAKVSDTKPMSCYLWHLFAKNYSRGETSIDGHKVQTLARAQEEMGNVAPFFVYGRGVPFNIVEKREESSYEGHKVSRTQKLVGFKF